MPPAVVVCRMIGDVDALPPAPDHEARASDHEARARVIREIVTAFDRAGLGRLDSGD